MPLSGLVAAGVHEALMEALDRRMREDDAHQRAKAQADQLALQRETLAGAQQDRTADNERQMQLVDLAKLKYRDDQQTAQTQQNARSDMAGVLQMPGMDPAAMNREIAGSALRTNTEIPKGVLDLIKIDPEKKPTLHSVTVPGPDGKPMAKGVTDEEYIKGVPTYVAPKEPSEHLTAVTMKDPATGKTITQYLSNNELRGKTFDKALPSILENRMASATAVIQTGEDIVRHLSDPAYVAALGPVMGRASTLRQFIGNPPPEFSELAGQIESYSLANMGVHGMRSAEGAKVIANLLDQPQTPESLAKAIQGLNGFATHLLTNEGRAPTTPAASPVAAPAKKQIRYDLNGKIIP